MRGPIVDVFLFTRLWYANKNLHVPLFPLALMIVGRFTQALSR
jgi:hypothetical protein